MNALSLLFNDPIPYLKALEFQYRLLKARQNNEIPDIVLLMQHTPVITLGNRGRDNYLLKSRDEYKKLGIDLYKVERGGDVTFHGPGQWVLYPIIRLGENEADAHGYLYNLEEISIRVLNHFGINGFRKKGKSGAWTDKGKVAAIGFRLKKWVTMHGMSFNVSSNLSGFDFIVPCGLKYNSVTSLEDLLENKPVNFEDVGLAILNQFSSVCNRKIINYKSNLDIPKELKKYNPPL